MKTLILSPRFTPDSIALRNAAIDAGWMVERLASWRPSLALIERPGIDPIPYGEPLFAAVIAESLGLALIEPGFSWLAKLPRELRKRNIEFTSLAQARIWKQRAFIKPADDKCFPARVYESGNELPPEEALGNSVPVLISEPVIWESEFRAFVLERAVTTISIYSRWGETAQASDGAWPATTAEMDAVRNFCESVVGPRVSVDFPPAAVLDVGLIEGRGWAVVEANACWGAGIYGCDPRQVLDTLFRACQHRSTLSDADRRWIIERDCTNLPKN